MSGESKTLTKNKISHFFLRIDLQENIKIDFKMLANNLKDKYLSFKTETCHNYNLDLNNIQVTEQLFETFIFDGGEGTLLKLSPREKSIVLESKHYKDNSIYKDRVLEIIKCLEEQLPDIKARRIGMRYINNFPCIKKTDINKIFETSKARGINDSLKKSNITRAIILEEFQEEEHYVCVQFGIPNKFYPSVITCYDLLLDIDVYNSGLQNIENWEDSIKEYNHAAFEVFTNYIKETYITSIK